jgi:hypothetical protein
MIRRLNQALDEWIFSGFSTSTEALGLFRIVYCLLIIFFLGLPNFSWIAAQPDYFFDPRLFSLQIAWSGFPSVIFFQVITVLSWLAFAFLLVGYHTKKTSYILSLLIILGKGFAYSFGKIDHDIFTWIIPLIMAESHWGESFSIDSKNHPVKREAKSWPLALLALLLGFAFFTAAAPKMLGGWLSLETQATKAHLVYNYFVVGRQEIWSSAALAYENKWVWEAMDWTAIIFELFFAIAIFRTRWLGLAIVIALGFHWINLMLFNIAFVFNLPAYLAFLPWKKLAAPIKTKVDSIQLRISSPAWLLGAILLCLSMGYLTSPWAISGRTLQWDLFILSGAMLTGLIFSLLHLHSSSPAKA